MFRRLGLSIQVSALDLAVILGLFVGGTLYHWDYGHWANGLIGGQPYGDAHFWWDGAVRVSEGMFQDHPGKGFRPGYFLLAGLSLPALGADGATFHKFLLVNFLAASAFLYLALRGPLGRPGAAAGVFLFVANPYTAEWIATTTTDGLGLVLNLAAVACLVSAVRSDLNRRWLAGFGALFAVATLTRPLVTPFIGLVLLAVLLQLARPWRERLTAAGVCLVAFLVPTLLWMGVQRAWVGEWSVSTNDAPALYAASDPGIQVWSPAMYRPILAKTRARYKTAEPTPAQVNQEFRRQTIKNYLTHYRYHLGRSVPHLWAVAAFSPGIARNPTTTIQFAILSGLAAALAAGLLVRGLLVRGLVLGVAGALPWMSPHAAGLLTVAGCFLALLARPGRTADLALQLVSGYWLVGVLALFVAGGTWSPTHDGSVHINALGYRIGSQVFFAGDLLACLSLVRLASLNLAPERTASGAGLLLTCRALLARAVASPVGFASVATAGLLAVVLAGDAGVLAWGSVAVTRRAWTEAYAESAAYPDPAPVIELYRDRSPADAPGDLRSDGDNVTRLALLTPKKGERAEGPDVLVTGAVGTCVWNLTGQRRALVFLHPQADAVPSRLTASYREVELPGPLTSSEWTRRQGAFVLRECIDRAPVSNLPYYLEGISVRAFVPLTPDGRAYDTAAAVWFPLTRHASQLDAAGSLACTHGTLTWSPDSGPVSFQRRFLVTPSASDKEEARVELELKLDRAVGHRTLRFGYRADAEYGGEPEVWAVRAGSPGGERLLPQATEGPAGLRELEIDCGGPDVTAVRVSFRGVPAGGVWVHEFNLTADDFRP